MLTETNHKPVIQNIKISQNYRGLADIATWRNAIKAAENVANPRRVTLYDLYEEALLDGHLSAVIAKRMQAITNTPLHFIQGNKINEQITELISSENFIQLLEYILESKLWGHSLIELNISNQKLSTALIPRKHVLPIRGEIVTNQYDFAGFNYRQQPYCNYLLEVGDTKSLGLLMQCTQYVIFKRNCLSDWSSYAETFGTPLRVAKYEGFDETARKALENAMEAAGNAAYVILPKDAQIDFIQNNTQGSAILYDMLVDSLNKELSKIIVGQTMTSEAGGSLAQAKVHLEVEHDINTADKLFVAHILNDKLKPLLNTHGFNVTNGKFIFQEQEKIDLPTRLQMDLKLSERVKIDDEYFYKTYNIPKPIKNLTNGSSI